MFREEAFKKTLLGERGGFTSFLVGEGKMEMPVLRDFLRESGKKEC